MSLRLVTSIVATFIAITTAGAQEWQSFGVRHAGFVFDVPPEFALDQVAKDGTGATFVYPKNATLTVWGDKLLGSEFEAKIKAQLNKDESAGWGNILPAHHANFGKAIQESKMTKSAISGRLRFATTVLRFSSWITTARIKSRMIRSSREW